MYDEILGKGNRPAKDTLWGGDEVAEGGSGACLQAAMAASLQAPAAPGQLFQPAFIASGGEVVIRHAVAAAVAKHRGVTEEENAKRKVTEAEAKKLKPKRKPSKGVMQSKGGARPKKEQVQKLRQEDQEAAADAVKNLANAESRKRKRNDKQSETEQLGNDVLMRTGIKAARLAGDVEDLHALLQKLSNKEKEAVITVIDVKSIPKKKNKEQLNKVVTELDYSGYSNAAEATSDSAWPNDQALPFYAL